MPWGTRTALQRTLPGTEKPGGGFSICTIHKLACARVSVNGRGWLAIVFDRSVSEATAGGTQRALKGYEEAVACGVAGVGRGMEGQGKKDGRGKSRKEQKGVWKEGRGRAGWGG